MTSRRARAIRTRPHGRGQRRALAALIGVALCHGGSVAVAFPAAGASAPAADAVVDASFDRSMLSGAGQNTTDLSRFERGNFVPAGSYSVDIFLNERPVGRSDVRFAAPSADASATACVTPALLDLLGLHPADVTAQTTADLANPALCVDIGRVVPGASMDFDMGDLRLDTSVPQASMGLAARGYVAPKYWNSGVTAGLLNYNFNTYRTSGQGLTLTSSYLGLNAGLNLGRWHLRQDSSLTWQSGVGGARSTRHWQSIATYAQRDLPSLRAQLTVGDSWTGGEIFDSVGVRGVQIATDDRMLPQSLRGYAPTVRGVADSNAKVTIRQNGMVIYQITVAPGPFAITDLYATGYGGDLEVSVTEANGRVHTFSVPYASVPQLLRPGVNRFSVVAGQLRDNAIHGTPGLVQATWQRGFDNLLTGYAGVAGSQGYGSALLGAAFNTRFGAFAMDVTSTRSRIPGFDTLSGQSVRLSYSKLLAQTGTSLSVAAYRYSTSGFLSLGAAERARDYARRGLPVFATGNAGLPQTINGVPVSGLLTPQQQAALLGGDYRDYVVQSGVDRQRNNFSITLSQTLGDRGRSLFVTGSARDYWNRTGTDTQYQVGYNNRLGRVSYSVSASRERDLFGHNNDRYMVSLTIPLGDNTSAHVPVLTGSVAHDTAGGMQEQAMVSGTAGANDQFTHVATASHDNTENSGSTASVTGGYRGTHVQVNAGFGHGSGYSQASLDVSGGVVAHPGGVIFGQQLGDTVAIVEAPHAAGARVGNAAGLLVDKRGYALVPYLTPYMLNTVTIDPTGLPLDVQFDNTSMQIAPRAGAVVMVKFKSEHGQFLLIQTQLPGGKVLSFGAEVRDEDGQVVGVVGQAGRIMVRVERAAGRLSVSWGGGEGREHQCGFDYRAPTQGPHDRAGGYPTQQAVCVATPTTAAATEANQR